MATLDDVQPVGGALARRLSRSGATLCLGLCLAAGFASHLGCTGDAGPPGPPGTGEVGDKGDPGEPGGPVGDPSVSGIVPGTVYLDRKVDVSISGFATSWTGASVDTSSIDFGPGITVDSVVVASTGSLVASVRVDRDAATGPRDVTVDGLSYSGAFHVESPIVVHLLEDPSTVLQGSIVLARIEQRDQSTPFHQGFLYDGPNNPPKPTMTVEAFGSSRHNVADVAPYSALVELRIDVDAPAGPSDLEVTVGSINDSVVTSRAANGIDVIARTPEPLPTAPVTITTPRESHLYGVTTQGQALVNIDFQVDTVTHPLAQVALIALEPSGHFEDELPISGAFVAKTAGTYYLVVQDYGEEVGYDYQLDVNVDPITITPLTVGVPVSGAIAVADEVDFYSFPSSANQEYLVELTDGATSFCYMPPFIQAEVVVFDPSFVPMFGDPFAQCNPLYVPPFLPTGTSYLGVRGSEPQNCSGCTFDYTLVVNAL